jgi:DNA-binding LacI/PurR family transcriptional regulator
MPPPEWLRHWHGDGILARIKDHQMGETIRQTKLPAIDLRYSVPNFGLPHVGLDTKTVVGLAFQHLTDCGFRHFGFCGLSPGQKVWLARDCDDSRSVSPRFIRGQRPPEQVAQLRTNAHGKGRLDPVDGG